jgi:hypothetical protein
MTARKIAGKLNLAQRAAFRARCTASLPRARRLVSLGLFGMYARDAISKLVMLHEETPLGLEVRAILEEQGNG